jgi:glyoxylase I family protein
VHRAVFLDAGDDRLIELFDARSAAPGGSAPPLDPERRPSDAARGQVAALIHFAIRTDDVSTLGATVPLPRGRVPRAPLEDHDLGR